MAPSRFVAALLGTLTLFLTPLSRRSSQVQAADECVRSLEGRKNWRNLGLTTSAHFWDGVTDYTNVTEEQKHEEEEKRHEEFGDWIDNQEVPEEFRPRED